MNCQLVFLSCPRCFSSMILRDGSRGKFYGCSRFPRCRGTRDAPQPTEKAAPEKSAQEG
ncbi:MAG TPA: topoisomerase DNA-binding C4 zinc finger domain-containing protein [Candidatus Paceibacterota bacterium]|nr:topoisomerase DNA-binding C4 zinc finger domain-containing protein [Candidatus Paceibacterota bacterium]